MQHFTNKAEMLTAFEKIIFANWKNRSGKKMQAQKIEGKAASTEKVSKNTNKRSDEQQSKAVKCYSCGKMGH